MIANIIGILILIGLVVLFGWLTKRSWGSGHRILKWPALVLSALATLLLATITIVAAVGVAKTGVPVNYPVADLKVASTPDQIARGERFAYFCAGCHSSTGKLPLNGGDSDFAGPPIATIYPPNLTPAGEIKNWTDGEMERALREGVHKDGRPLLVMPSDVFHNLSDADAQSIIAYLRSQPAVPHSSAADTPSNGVTLLGALLVGAGLFQTSVQPEITGPVPMPAAGVTSGYGQYLVSVIGCRTCHGENLAGGKENAFGPPAGPNLTVLVPKWTETDFIKTIRSGADPTGHTLSDQMPWEQISAFATDDDLKAIYQYLHGLTPVLVPNQ
jgi:mono/diheme cytochrome c family protein